MVRRFGTLVGDHHVLGSNKNRIGEKADQAGDKNQQRNRCEGADNQVREFLGHFVFRCKRAVQGLCRASGTGRK